MLTDEVTINLNVFSALMTSALMKTGLVAIRIDQYCYRTTEWVPKEKLQIFEGDIEAK